MKFQLNIQPELLERLVLATESIAESLRLLRPSPLTSEDIPERERRPLPPPSGVNDLMEYGDVEAARDYEEGEDEEFVSQPLAVMDADPMELTGEDENAHS